MTRAALSKGTPANSAASVFGRCGRVVVSGLLLGSLALTFAPGIARADDLDDQQVSLAQQVSASDDEVTAEDQALATAQDALASSRQQLASAQTALASAQSDRDAAAKKDSDAQAGLDAATAALAKANDDLAAAQEAVAAQKKSVGSDARASVQQSTSLVTIGLLISGASTSDLSDRVQWTDQALRAQQTKLDQLNSAQLRFEQAQQRQQAAQAQADRQRAAAAQTLAAKQQAAEAAEKAKQQVDALVTQRNDDEAAAQRALAAAQSKNAQLKAQQQELVQQIQRRNEERAAEAARQAAAAQLAAQQAAAAQKQQADEAAAAATAQAAAASSAAAGRSTPSSTAAVLTDPVPGAPVTSPYGYRINPVRGTSELHDGVDLGGACGAPIYAAGAGTVSQILTPDQSGGYGNRLVIDHGLVNGVYLSTGYNHAESYVVGVGAQVSQGQLIGYVGTTGLSTGCHLHFHVYVNGAPIDPLTWITLS
ncbi:Murein DD-endopeptidase MepM and murein hydrolase activator NlpD, contain LysM domain [Propionibacterium cyclohexanicum]|uniref:Murein DD-endopeptidase MepM and murein hydrolase activator NlpD, contain LysM domain n=1 Tax=Propionibacterium cyclohexanicum TaxID=64702 RepID=A0A1H9R7T4_9ACTN|nr:M23 family metallopeptidase [Propionibacterium cyclohexanicum]SER68667.1 Murein DD-endopeptidase MepM and murein hydrolase activator NlpD, contain LysM domain [Propionibacterium cyclohexanicum]